MTEIAAQPPLRWTPPAAPADAARPGLRTAIGRGLRGLCPNCGQAPLFTGWLRVRPACAHCAAPLGRVRADDAPPYVVIFLTGHLVIAAEVMLDSAMQISPWAEAAIFLPLTLAMCLGLLRPVKGAIVGLMLHLGMVSPEHA